MVEPTKEDAAAAQRRFNVSVMQAMDAMAAQLRELESRIDMIGGRPAAASPSVEVLSEEIATLKQTVQAMQGRIVDPQTAGS